VHLALCLLFGLAFCLRLGSLRLLLCSGLCLFARSPLRLFPTLFLLPLHLLTSTTLLRFGVEDVRLVFATGLQLRRGGLRPILGLSGSRGDGAGELGNVRHIVRGQRTEGTGKTGLIFIDPKFVLRHSLRALHCSRRPHVSLIGASWVRPLKGGYCYDHVQLRALSGYSSRIAALQLNSGRASLTPVMVVQIYLHYVRPLV